MRQKRPRQRKHPKGTRRTVAHNVIKIYAIKAVLWFALSLLIFPFWIPAFMLRAIDATEHVKAGIVTILR
jgi:hypothetical protein